MKFTEVPFYPQKWDLTKWKELGFSSQEKAKYWERSCCGILCLKMAFGAIQIRTKNKLTPQVSEIIKQGLVLGAYTHAKGWDHSGLVRLADNYGFTAETFSRISIKQLVDYLKNGFFPIISIKCAFQVNKTLKEKIFFWKKSGGHLALVIGYEEKDGKISGFYVHHTSIRQEYNWADRFIPIKEFKRGFTGRGILIK